MCARHNTKFVSKGNCSDNTAAWENCKWHEICAVAKETCMRQEVCKWHKIHTVAKEDCKVVRVCEKQVFVEKGNMKEIEMRIIKSSKGDGSNLSIRVSKGDKDKMQNAMKQSSPTEPWSNNGSKGEVCKVYKRSNVKLKLSL
eukprot:14342671-Ditylum_brightwellii.AAC.1